MFNEKVKVKRIDISRLLGNVTIKTHDAEEVRVETTEEDKVEIKHSIQTLYIKTKDDETDNSINISSGNIFGRNSSITINGKKYSGNNIVIGNGNVISNGNIVGSFSNMAKVKMTIYVPKDMIKSIDVSGQINVEVENISERIEIDNSGQTTVEVKGVERINLDTSGQSNVSIYNVKKLKADISGQSDIDIDSDEIEKIEIDISGQSRFNVKSMTIENLKADVSGMSDLIVHGQVVNKKIYESGMSKVRFK